MAAKKEHQFYTPQQAGDILQLNVRTVLGLIKTKQLFAVLLGRQYRIPREALERLKNDQTEAQKGGQHRA